MQTVNQQPDVMCPLRGAFGTPRVLDCCYRRPILLLLLPACMAVVAAVLCLGAGGAAAVAAEEAAQPAAASLPPTWRLGENLETGDSYTYEICHSVHAAEATYPDPCYTLRMDFVHRMTHHAYGPVWIVAVDFDGRGTVMLLDYNTMTVRPTSAWDVWLADSIQDTVLHLAPYGEQGLEVGAYWGEIDTYFYSVPLSITSQAGDRFVLGYDTAAESRTVIMPDMPFPEYSRWYDSHSISADPRIVHEYTLVR